MWEDIDIFEHDAAGYLEGDVDPLLVRVEVIGPGGGAGAAMRGRWLLEHAQSTRLCAARGHVSYKTRGSR